MKFSERMAPMTGTILLTFEDQGQHQSSSKGQGNNCVDKAHLPHYYGHMSVTKKSIQNNIFNCGIVSVYNTELQL